MKALIVLFGLTVVFHFQSLAQTNFKLDPRQSMCMTGKGPGQDATINPYYGEDCYAVVENTGKLDFSIRVQQQGEIIQTIAIEAGEVKQFKLLKDHVLYLDPNEGGIAEAMVDYKGMEKQCPKD